jgi:formylglycine-generating enzyme required for sulfatase activity
MKAKENSDQQSKTVSLPFDKRRTHRSCFALIAFIFCAFLTVFPIISSTQRDTINIKEMERFSYNIFQYEGDDDLKVEGYVLTDGTYSRLPIGATLDKEKGIIYWLPGPGFLGEYELLFKSAALGEEKTVNVRISPKYGELPENGPSRNVSSVSAVGQPFGSFDTPIDGSTVTGSIAVTGWVLDDTGIANVKIWRGETGNLTYIGDAMQVEGARPDVAALYPDYPNNAKAGWGYMLLTNFLPGGGNGTFKLHAIATDKAGNSTGLGTKTIHVDNAHAVKPFGAIDTPTQGGFASGKKYINWGWALTPQPNSIPTDGSTIHVWVDGVNIGQPTYNIFRSDIALLFPNYANSSGAVGYLYLDTGVYANGVHTIQWTARDSAGNSDGIGSRYFTISGYFLDVTKGTGVNGYPDSGSSKYEEGAAVNYSYCLISGYTNLEVKLDGGTIANSGTITMDSDHTLTATATLQITCTYSISPSSLSFSSSGGTGTISVSAASGCSWTASESYSWLNITAGSSGNGNGTVTYSVSANNSSRSRTGSITVAGKTHTLKQSGSIPSIEWINIPAGNFQMGDNFGEGYGNEIPVHTVYLDAYKISKYEVTFDQYDAFCDATGRRKPIDYGWGRGNRPVMDVSWLDAKAFCDWMSQKTGKNIHLPTEAQWEKAARGTDQRRYPWGNTSPTCGNVNYNYCQVKTMPVGSYPSGVSFYGVHDMAGNVYEWCADWYSSSYYSISPGSNPSGPPGGFYKVLRGGYFLSDAENLRAARRHLAPPYDRSNGIGFHLAQD